MKSLRIVVLVSVVGAAVFSVRPVAAAEGLVVPSPDPRGTQDALSNDLSRRAPSRDVTGSASAPREGLGESLFISRSSALSHRAGAEGQRPLPSVVIGGITTSTLLTLIVLPTLYELIEAWVLRRREED